MYFLGGTSLVFHKKAKCGELPEAIAEFTYPPEIMDGKGIPGNFQLVPPGITFLVIPWKMQLCAGRKLG